MSDVQADGSARQMDGSGLRPFQSVSECAAPEPTIRCTKCGELKPREQFRTQMSRHGRPSRHRSCIGCQSKVQKARRKLDEVYWERNRERVREHYHSLSTEQRAEFIRKCTERRRARMMRDPEYAAIEREKARNRVAMARAQDPKRRELDAEYARAIAERALTDWRIGSALA